MKIEYSGRLKKQGDNMRDKAKYIALRKLIDYVEAEVKRIDGENSEIIIIGSGGIDGFINLYSNCKPCEILKTMKKISKKKIFMGDENERGIISVFD